ncbi:MAG: 6-carboxytetrahydropterin synthase [Bacteroidales bacterium]|nr:6-carboxytetrahydropterin synthase [Bacteroidales bacterium]
MIYITKIFSFEAAHALKDYKGACANIHGHSYRLEVSIAPCIGSVAIDDDGMIWDFNNLKKVVQETLLNRFDHSLLLNSSNDTSLLETLKGQFEKVLLLPFQPTSENLVQHFASMLKAALPERLRLKRMILYETATSFVTYEEE